MTILFERSTLTVILSHSVSSPRMSMRIKAARKKEERKRTGADWKKRRDWNKDNKCSVKSIAQLIISSKNSSYSSSATFLPASAIWKHRIPTISPVFSSSLSSTSNFAKLRSGKGNHVLT